MYPVKTLRQTEDAQYCQPCGHWPGSPDGSGGLCPSERTRRAFLQLWRRPRQWVKYNFIKTTFIKKNTFIKKTHFHQKTTFIQKPLLSKNHFHQKNTFIKITLIFNLPKMSQSGKQKNGKRKTREQSIWSVFVWSIVHMKVCCQGLVFRV